MRNQDTSRKSFMVQTDLTACNWSRDRPLRMSTTQRNPIESSNTHPFKTANSNESVIKGSEHTIVYLIGALGARWSRFAHNQPFESCQQFVHFFVLCYSGSQYTPVPKRPKSSLVFRLWQTKWWTSQVPVSSIRKGKKFKLLSKL